jgi:hypothetical protein
VPTRYAARHCNVSRRAVPDHAMGQASAHDTAHGPQPFSSCSAGPWHDSHGTPEEEDGRAERR